MTAAVPTIGLLGRAADHADLIGAALANRANLVQWRPGDSQTLLDAVSVCEVVVVGPDAAHGGFVKLDLRSIHSLRLVLLPFAGHDWLPAERLPPGCLAANTYEHDAAIAEYVLAAMLHLEVRLDLIDQRFRAGQWVDWGAQGGTPHGELAGKRLGIVGYGRIGQAVAARALPFDMQIVATGSRPRPGLAGLLWHGGPERLDELLQTSDYVVLACDLNEQTRNLIHDQRVALLKSSAVLINVARAPVVHEEALFEALSKRRLRGAVLDVWRRYPRADDPAPRPSTLPFWELDNVVMTPHCSASTLSKEQRRWSAVARTLSEFVGGVRPQTVFAVGPEPALSSTTS